MYKIYKIMHYHPRLIVKGKEVKYTDFFAFRLSFLALSISLPTLFNPKSPITPPIDSVASTFLPILIPSSLLEDAVCREIEKYQQKHSPSQ